MLHRLLFSKIDNSPLLIFRIFFGILVSLECYGAIATGWVRRTLVEPQFTFSFISFEWIQPLPGNGMYIYFFIMGTLGLLITLGYKYRFSIIAFTVMWTGVYLMQKSSYNNHYYLLILISLFMCFFPANRGYSLDARQHPGIREESMYGYVKWVIVAQLFLVYTYASIAKFYGDWLDFSFIELLMKSKSDYAVIGPFLQLPWAQKIIAIAGILFDLLVVPALLWKPTRKWAFGLSIFFHLFNSVVFQIGIFPYLSLAFTVFFFEPETIRKIFFKKRPKFEKPHMIVPSYKSLFLIGAGAYFLIQLLLPIRHHLIEGDVLWTEEGHRMSWRMMLRSRSGTIQFQIKNKKTGELQTIRLSDYLTKKQRRRISSYPDFIWQFAQRLKKEYATQGQEIAVFVRSRVKINKRQYQAFIDPEVDLASVPWEHFKHHKWILPWEPEVEEANTK